MAWATNGIIVNPTTDQILATTGALGAGLASLSLLLWSDTGCLLNLNYRNALYTLNNATQVLHIDANAGSGRSLPPIPIVMLLNERFTVTVRQGFTGRVQASLVWS